jgi:hypothetical protein
VLKPWPAGAGPIACGHTVGFERLHPLANLNCDNSGIGPERRFIWYSCGCKPVLGHTPQVVLITADDSHPKDYVIKLVTKDTWRVKKRATISF